jgi:hypothetical protein
MKTPGSTVYVLAEEDYGGTFSSPYLPIGIAVTSREEAERWVNEEAPKGGVRPRTFWEVQIKGKAP